MFDIRLDKAAKAFTEGYRAIFAANPEDLTPSDIKDLNNSPLPKGKKKALVSTLHEVTATTFIIPVSDGGNITAYYFISPKQAKAQGTMPLTVFFHGGGWLYGNLDLYTTFLKRYAYQMETAVLLVDYRLAPDHKFPTAIEDCYDALLWAIEGTKYWKIDPDMVYVAGDGAGASLAATVAILLRDRKGPSLAGQILLYPLVDCRLRTQSMEVYKETPTLTLKNLSWYIKNYSREPKDMLSPMMSPLLFQDLSRLPDALVIGAECDPLADDCRLYAEALKNADTKAKALMVKDAFHGFMPFKKAKGRKEAETAIWQFMKGRNVENIEFLNLKEFRKFRKSHT